MADWGTPTKIVQMSRITAAGEIVKYYRLSFTSNLGAALTADISEADYEADKAESVMQVAAERADKILSL